MERFSLKKLILLSTLLICTVICSDCSSTLKILTNSYTSNNSKQEIKINDYFLDKDYYLVGINEDNYYLGVEMSEEKSELLSIYYYMVNRNTNEYTLIGTIQNYSGIINEYYYNNRIVSLAINYNDNGYVDFSIIQSCIDGKQYIENGSSIYYPVMRQLNDDIVILTYSIEDNKQFAYINYYSYENKKTTIIAKEEIELHDDYCSTGIDINYLSTSCNKIICQITEYNNEDTEELESGKTYYVEYNYQTGKKKKLDYPHTLKAKTFDVYDDILITNDIDTYEHHSECTLYRINRSGSTKYVINEIGDGNSMTNTYLLKKDKLFVKTQAGYSIINTNDFSYEYHDLIKDIITSENMISYIEEDSVIIEAY